MGLESAIGRMRAARVQPRVKRSNAQGQFAEGLHKKRKISEWTGADVAAFRRQIAEFQGWDPGPSNQRRDNALGARLIKQEGGPREAAGLVLAACCGADFGIEKPRDLSWLVGRSEYRTRAQTLKGPCLEAAKAELPGVTATVTGRPRLA